MERWREWNGGGNESWRMANVLLLGMGWMLAMSGLFVNISMTSSAVSRFAGQQLSTVPVGLHMISSAVSLCIAYFAIPRFGRRTVYIVAGLLGAVGSAVMIVGSRLETFGLLLAGSILQGPSFGVAQSFRFTAAAFFPAPQFSHGWRTRSISITVGCAVFAAGIGPEATRVVRDELGKDFTGGYTLLVGLYLAQALLTGLVDFQWLEHIQKGQQQQQQQQQYHQQHLNEAVPHDVQHCKEGRHLSNMVVAEGDEGEEQLQQEQQQQQPEEGQEPGLEHAWHLLHQKQQVQQQRHESQQAQEMHETGPLMQQQQQQQQQQHQPHHQQQRQNQQQRVQDSVRSSGGGGAPTHVDRSEGGRPPWPLHTSHLQLSAVSAQQDSHVRLPAICRPSPAPAAVAQQDACSRSPLFAPNRPQGVLCRVVPVDTGSAPQKPCTGRPQSSSMLGQQGVALSPDHGQVDVPPGPSLVQALTKVNFIVPALSGATAFFTMAAVMSSTPDGMQVSGHSSDLATFTIEAHVGAMYLPALLVGDLVNLVRLVISSTMNSKYMVVRLVACMVFLVLPQQQQQQQQQQQHDYHLHHHHQQQQYQQPPQHPRQHKQLQHAGQLQHEKQQHEKLQHEKQQQDTVAIHSQTPDSEGDHAATSIDQPVQSNTVPHTAPITFVMVLGSAVLASSPGVLLAGTTLQHFMGGLVLLGVGWALNYITASSLVTAAFSDPEQLRMAQSIMDLSVLTLMAAGNATAGVMVRLWGWQPFLTLYLAIILALLACNLMYHAHVVLYYRRTVPVAHQCQTAKEVTKS